MNPVSLRLDNLRESTAPLYRLDDEERPLLSWLVLDPDGAACVRSDVPEGSLYCPVPSTLNGDTLANYLESEQARDLLAGAWLWLHESNVSTYRHIQGPCLEWVKLCFDLQDLPRLTIYTASQWVERFPASRLWPEGLSLFEAADRLEELADREGFRLHIAGDLMDAIIQQIKKLLDMGEDVPAHMENAAGGWA